MQDEMRLTSEQKQRLVTARQHMLRKMKEIVLARKHIFSQFSREMQAYPPVSPHLVLSPHVSC